MDKTVKITKDKLIRNISLETGKSMIEVKNFYNALEHIIFDTLSNVDNEKNVSIKLFEGISLNGSFIPKKEKLNNLTGEMSFIDSKIKPKFNITRSYCEKLNNK